MDKLTLVALWLVPVLMVAGFWIDYRYRSREQHLDNIGRLAKIETKLEPMWKWWIRQNRDSE